MTRAIMTQATSLEHQQ